MREIIVFNKIDTLDQTALARLCAMNEEASFISAMTGTGIQELLEQIGETVENEASELTLEIPYDRGDLLSDLHESGQVLATEHNETGTAVTVRLPHAEADRFRSFIT